MSCNCHIKRVFNFSIVQWSLKEPVVPDGFAAEAAVHTFKSKKVHKLPVVKYYLDKVENKSYQGVEFSGFANAKER